MSIDELVKRIKVRPTTKIRVLVITRQWHLHLSKHSLLIEDLGLEPFDLLVFCFELVLQLCVVGRLSAQTVVHYVDAAFERLVFVLHFFIGLVQVFEIPPVVLVNHLGQVRLQQARGACPVACLAAEPVQDPLARLVYECQARGLRVSVGLLV